MSLLMLSALVLAGVPNALGVPSEEDRPVPSTVGPLIIDDVPEPLDPKQPRTEADEDRVEALSRYAAGLMLERQGEYSRALRHYQRALRCDPQAVNVAREIVSLAFVLKRYDQAARYALRLEPADLEDANPRLLYHLAGLLDEQHDWARAVKLYERVVAARAGTEEKYFDLHVQKAMGRAYYLVAQYGKAADSFSRVLHALDHPEESGLDEEQQKDLLGKAGLTYGLFGECLLQADRVDEAVEAFERAHRVAPNKGVLQFNLARTDARRDKPERALDALQVCFKQRLASEGMAPYELLAELLEALGKKDELIGRLEKLHAYDPKNVPLAYFLAGSYRETKQLEKAERLDLALAETTPTPTGYRSLVEIYRETNRPEALLAVLGEAAAKTGTLEGLGAQGQAVFDDADLLRTLIETARKKYQAEPKKLDYGVRLAVALLALESKQFETAAEFVDLALKAQPEKAAELLPVWGIELLFAERSAEAATCPPERGEALVTPEENGGFYFYLAGALAADDRTDEALAAARKAVELKKDSPLFHSRAAWVLYRAKRNDEAIKAYTELIDKFDSDYKSPAIREALRETRFALSNLCVFKEDLAPAEEWLEQVLDEFPDDVGAFNDLGYLWADQGKHLNRALKMIRQAVDAEPENVAYRDSLGWVLYRLGRYQEAVAELEKAAAGDDGSEPDAVILDHLGDAHLKANQPKKAKDAWGRAVKAFQKEEEPEKAKAVEDKIKANE